MGVGGAALEGTVQGEQENEQGAGAQFAGGTTLGEQ